MARARGNTFQADVTCPHTGKRFRPAFNTLLAAEVWELQALAALKMGLPLPPTPTEDAGPGWTLGEMLDWAYREHWAKESGNPSYFTKNIKIMKEDLGEHFPAADLIGKAGYGRIVEACKLRGNANDTINKKASLISKALKLSITEGKLQGVNMVPYPRLKRAPGRTFIFTREQEVACLKFLNTFDPEMAQWFIMGMDVGFRSYSEGLHIYPWVDVRGTNLFIKGRLIEEAEDIIPSAEVIDLATARRRTKTGEGKSRSVGMTKRVQAIVEDWRKKLHNRRNVAMFENLNKQRVRDHWALMREAAGITDDECVPYSLRHTFGTRCILAGIDVDTLKTLMGHSTRAMTEKYVHLAGLVETGAAVKLDKFLGGEE